MPVLTFLDCETCSLAGGIIELSLAIIPSLQAAQTLNEEAFKSLLQTERFKNPIPIDEGALAIHGIQESVLAGLPLYSPADFYKHFVNVEDVIPLEEVAEHIILVGHNVATFDRPRMELMENHKTIDAMNLARLLEKTGDLTHNLGEFKAGNKLDTLVSLYCPEYSGHQTSHHGSARDCFKTLIFLQWLLAYPLKGANEEELIFLSSTKNTMPMRKALLKNIQKRSNVV